MAPGSPRSWGRWWLRGAAPPVREPEPCEPCPWSGEARPTVGRDIVRRRGIRSPARRSGRANARLLRLRVPAIERSVCSLIRNARAACSHDQPRAALSCRTRIRRTGVSYGRRRKGRRRQRSALMSSSSLSRAISVVARSRSAVSRLLVFRRVEARPCARVKAVVASAMDWIRALLTRFDQPRGKAMTCSEP